MQFVAINFIQMASAERLSSSSDPTIVSYIADSRSL